MCSKNTCHSLHVIFVISRWCLSVRWSESIAAFDFLKCRSTGHWEPKRQRAKNESLHKTPHAWRGLTVTTPGADTRLSAWEKLDTQGQLSTKETAHWNASRGETDVNDADVQTTQPIHAQLLRQEVHLRCAQCGTHPQAARNMEGKLSRREAWLSSDNWIEGRVCRADTGDEISS